MSRPRPDDHTMPWHPRELLTVNNIRLAYDFGRLSGAMIVRLPGGGASTIYDLQQSGAIVVMPQQLRELA